MLMLQKFVQAFRNPDIRWLRNTLVPRMVADADIIANTLSGGLGNHRVFQFDGRDVEFDARYQYRAPWVVFLRERGHYDKPVFCFLVKDGKGFGVPGLDLPKGTEDPIGMITTAAERLRAFGEVYLQEPISHFNYATPGEYLEWPNRELIEPPRVEGALPIPQINDMIRERVSSLQATSSQSPEQREAAEAEMRKLYEYRDREMKKTTHGRWLERYKEEQDRYWEAQGDMIAASWVAGGKAKGGMDDDEPPQPSL